VCFPPQGDETPLCLAPEVLVSNSDRAPSDRKNTSWPAPTRSAKLHEEIGADVAALHNDKHWTAMLDLSARMGSGYSLGNTLLIGLQRPDATCVAGYAA
jgi:hypothetical protein